MLNEKTVEFSVGKNYEHSDHKNEWIGMYVRAKPKWKCQS